MRDKILAALKQIENTHDCRILFAVESGSRAWGFASPDSDYDVRAVYVKPLDWYLQINEPSTDTITEMLPGDLDVVAWDLRKFLQHLNKSNTSLVRRPILRSRTLPPSAPILSRILPRWGSPPAS